MSGLPLAFPEKTTQGANRLIPITPDLLPSFQKILNNVQALDPMLRSAAYFALTGRDGLYLYGNDKTGMVIALHPNRKDLLLFFPPFGEDPAGLIKQALCDPALPEGGVQLARIPVQDIELRKKLENLGITDLEEEDVLDWRFPVHLVAPEKIIERKGKPFNNLRGHVNRAFRKGLDAKKIEIERHESDVMSVVQRWAERINKPDFAYGDLVGPAVKALALMKSGHVPVEGLIVYDGAEPVGFWLWDEAQLDKGIAVSLVRCSVGRHGAAEFAGLKTSELLKERGFVKFCFGGSETKKLDDFKRKFCPIKSIPLASKYGLKTLSFDN